MSDIKVGRVMTHLVATLSPETSVHEAAQRLASNHVSGAPVLEDGKVIGMVSESDLITALMPPVKVDHGVSILDALAVLARAKPLAHGHGKSVADVMSPLVFMTTSDASIWDAATRMDRHGVKRLPVVDEEGYLVGIISRADIVRAMARDDTRIADDVEDAIEVLGMENFHDLEVESSEGVVSINGLADRRSTRDLAIRIATRVPGVVEVVDHLAFDQDDKDGDVPHLRDPWAVGPLFKGASR